MEDYIIDEIFKVQNGVPSLGGISFGQPTGECEDRIDILRDAKDCLNPEFVYVNDYEIEFKIGAFFLAISGQLTKMGGKKF